jgi:dTDP-glucose 4,6-dehydratase
VQHLLVTGGAGFIGSNFVRFMLEKYNDLHITVYDKLTYAGLLSNLQDIAEKFPNRYSFAQGDICDGSRVAEVIAQHDIDTLVNFAAETHVDRSILDPNAFIQTDVFGTYVLLDAAHKAGNLRYHQISTDEVYGHIEEGHRSKETDNLAPRSPYAASKAGGDHLVNSYFITYGLPITISRGANNIGPYQYPEKAVPLFATNALNDQPLPVYGDGQQRRDYQHVLDHCEAIDLVLRKGTIGETYNIGTGTEMTNLEMIQILLDELGKPASLIRHVEDRMGHDRRYCLNVQKIMELGWEPDYTHEEAIRSTARWYVENRWWWEPIRNGDFKNYYQQLYGNRKVLERP